MEKREVIIKKIKDFLEGIWERYGLEMVFLYGSWVTGFPRFDSDIDIAIVFSIEPSSEDESFEKITEISLHLSRELNMEVNAILIREDFWKPMLYYNAIVQSIPVYIRNFNKYVGLKNEAIYQMEDFSIFGLKWQHDVAKKNLKDLRHA